jgi:hypothetical protein
MITNVQLHLPGSAPEASGLKAAAARFGLAVWDALHTIGAGRARSELLRVARVHESSNPPLAARLRELAREDWLTRS